jgi:nicotinamidase-related amidase
VLLHKRALDVFSNPNLPAVLRALEPETVVTYGVATEFCVRHTVEGLLRQLPRARLVLVQDAVRAIQAAEGERWITGWRERGVRVMDSAEILRGGSLEA